MHIVENADHVRLVLARNSLSLSLQLQGIVTLEVPVVLSRYRKKLSSSLAFFTDAGCQSGQLRIVKR